MLAPKEIRIHLDSDNHHLAGRTFSNVDALCGERNSSVRNHDLSIVVPLYNSERYLEATLNSVLANSKLLNMQVIVIDDGSRDNSSAIAHKLLASQERASVLLLEQMNSGLSAVRNRGVKCAFGDYLAFLDSDDFFAHDGYSSLVRLARKWNCDQIFCRSMVLDEADQSLTPFYDNWAWEQILKGRKFAAVEPRSEPQIFTFEPNAAPRVWKRDFFTNHNLYFPEGRKFEDLGTHILSLTEGKTIGLLNETFYYYRVGHSGKITSSTDESRFDVLHIAAELLKRLGNCELSDAVGGQIVFAIHRIVGWCGTMTPFDKQPAFYRQAKHLYRSIPTAWINSFLAAYSDNPSSYHFKNILSPGDGLPMKLRMWLYSLTI